MIIAATALIMALSLMVAAIVSIHNGGRNGPASSDTYYFDAK